MNKFNVILFNLISFLNLCYSFNLSPIPNFKLSEPNFRFHINKTESSYFGYTINFRKNSIIIGAPRAQSTLESQRKINETGAIYKCDLNTQTCNPFLIDTEGDIEDSLSAEYYGSLKKEKQWLGAAIDGHSSDSDRLIVCAPNIITNVRPDHYLFNGVCYLTTNTETNRATNLKIFAPLRYKRKQNIFINQQQNLQLWMFGQLGFSVHITDDSEEIIIGCPGVYMWKGTVARYKARPAFGLPGLSRRDLDVIQKQRHRREIEFDGEVANPSYWNQKDDSYFGYAITSGNFGGVDSNLPKTLYVASAPQGNMQIGEVVMFDFAVHPNNANDANERTIKIYRTFKGSQMGEYFGYALLVDDFNGDGLNDLLIAAPFRSKSSTQYENGQVYVYINKGSLSFSEENPLTSDYESNGRFGMTLGKIGDINQDGYKDVAVGAPFEENGVIHIFLGGPNGLSSKPSQKLIAPKNEYTNVPHYFGHGISKGVDYDQNGFNDLAVGAPNIDTVYVFKSYPVVKIIGSIAPYSQSISINETSSRIKTCLRYDSAAIINFNIELIVTYKLDPQLNRAKFKANGLSEYKRNVIVTSFDDCIDSDITLQYNFRDIFQPVVLEMHYELVNKFQNHLTFCKDCVAINPNDPSFFTNIIVFSTGCMNTRCVSDLSLKSEVKAKIPYILRSSKSLKIDYTIENYGETAYFVELTCELLTRSASFDRIPSNCRAEGNTLICNAAQGKPLLNKKGTLEENTIHFTLSIDTTKLDAKQLIINSTVTSSGDEKNPEDNNIVTYIDLEEFSDIEIIGKSSHREIALEETGLTVKNVEHIYEIHNLGPSNIKHMIFTISIPVTYIDEFSSNRLSLIDFKNMTVQGVYDNTEIQMKWSDNYEDMNEEHHSNEPVIIENLQGIEFDTTQNLGDQSNRDHSVQRRNIDGYNRYTNQVIYSHNVSKRSVSNEYDSTYSSLPTNRLIYFNCSTNNFCVHTKFSLRNFIAGEKIAQIKINFSIDLELIDKFYTEENDIFLMLTSIKVKKPGDDEGKSYKAIILNPYTIITKFIRITTPIWVIVLSILIGILVLAGLSYGLYKAGFFRRTKKEEMAKLVRQSQINNVASGDDETENDSENSE